MSKFNPFSFKNNVNAGAPVLACIGAGAYVLFVAFMLIGGLVKAIIAHGWLNLIVMFGQVTGVMLLIAGGIIGLAYVVSYIIGMFRRVVLGFRP